MKKIKKINHKNLSHLGVELRTLYFPVHTALPSSPSHFLSVDKQFYIKGKPCPKTHNFKMLGGQMGTLDLWISSLPLYHLSLANHVQWMDC